MTKSPHTAKLTKRAVDAITPKSTRFIVWDTDLPGFGIRIEPSGRKTFVARYRVGGGRAGRLRQPTIGRYGTVTPDEARQHARRILGAAATGGDPLGDRKKDRQTGLTVAEVCDWYLKDAQAERLLGKRGRPIKASTLAMDRSRIETHVKSLIGKRPVSSLSPSDLEQMQADIAAGKSSNTRGLTSGGPRPRGGIAAGGSGVAARTLGMIQAIFEHAKRHNLIANNPARGTRKIAGSPKRARLDFAQIANLGEAMRKTHDDEGDQTGLAALRFILLSGFRRNEALSIRGTQIDWSGGVDLSDSKSGPQIRPVGHAALEVLSTQAAKTPEDTWVFPSDRGNGHFVGLPRVLARVAQRAHLDGITVHVLRHTFASIAAELGYSELTIAGLLGHKAGSVTASYVHLDRALIAAANNVSKTIAEALDGKRSASIISPIREVG